MVTQTKTLNFVFGQKHLDYMNRCQRCQINVAEGAVRAGKTVDNAFAFAYELERTPDKIHLASGSTIGNAKLNIGDCNGYGLEAMFRGRCRWGKYKGNDALIVKTATGEKIIIFAGAELSSAFKKIRGNSYGMWIATEINLHHSSFIEEAFNRQLAAQHIKVFWDLNPSHPKHEIYTKYIDDYARKQKEGKFPAGYNYAHFTIFDNATLPAGRVEEIVSRYNEDSIWYIRDILGQRSIAEGLIYRNLASAFSGGTNPYRMAKKEVQKMVVSGEITRIICGVDFGGNGSGHAFVATAITADYSKVIVLRSERYMNGDTDAITGFKLEDIDPDKLAALFIRFLERILHDYNFITKINADSAETVLISGMKKAMRNAEYGYIRLSNALKTRINDRIFTTSSLAAGKRLFLTEDCETLENAFCTAVWNKKVLNLERLDDGTSDIDTLDAFEYTIEKDLKRLNRMDARS